MYSEQSVPWIAGDLIWPNAQPEVFCRTRESNVMLHTKNKFGHQAQKSFMSWLQFV